MKRLDRILAVLDPTTDEQPGLTKAARLAREFGATLELFVCDFDPALTGKPFFDTDSLRHLRDKFVNERRKWMDQMAQELREDGIAIETHVHWDNPLYRGILRRIEESSPDLVVKDTHYHSAIRRVMLTNTDWNLIRTSPVALLLTRAREWAASPRLLAALDPGHHGDKPAQLDHDILAYAALIAGRLGGEMHAVHAFFPAALLAATTGMAGLPTTTGVSAVDILDSERERVTLELKQLTASQDLPEAHVHLVQGSPVEVLPRIASELAADVLVMGAVSRSRLQEIFIGSTAERVVDRVESDLLIIKPGDFVAPAGP